jgi:hypothetical protein
MKESLRRFTVNDPFGRAWDVEFRWQQNAISIRHADAVDCKYYLSCGAERRELVVSLPHPVLLSVAAEAGRELSDAWVLRLAGLHVQRMISTWEDMDKTIAVVSRPEMAAYNKALTAAAAQTEAARR